MDRSDLDESVFFKKSTNKAVEFPIEGMIVAYVGDIIAAGYDSVVDSFYHEFEKSCTCSAPEELKYGANPITFIGFSYTRYRDYVKIDASEYTTKILEALSYTSCKPRLVPGDPGYFTRLAKNAEMHKFLAYA